MPLLNEGENERVLCRLLVLVSVLEIGKLCWIQMVTKQQVGYTMFMTRLRYDSRKGRVKELQC